MFSIFKMFVEHLRKTKNISAFRKIEVVTAKNKMTFECKKKV